MNVNPGMTLRKNHFSLASWLVMFLTQIFTWIHNEARLGLNDAA